MGLIMYQVQFFLQFWTISLHVSIFLTIVTLNVTKGTIVGIVSLVTGYYPPVHAQNGRFSFYDKEMTAALRVLAKKGYEIFSLTVGVLGKGALRRLGECLMDFKMDHGLLHYYKFCKSISYFVCFYMKK